MPGCGPPAAPKQVAKHPRGDAETWLSPAWSPGNQTPEAKARRQGQPATLQAGPRQRISYLRAFNFPAFHPPEAPGPFTNAQTGCSGHQQSPAPGGGGGSCWGGKGAAAAPQPHHAGTAAVSLLTIKAKCITVMDIPANAQNATAEQATAGKGRQRLAPRMRATTGQRPEQ